ncbi:Retrovirus-related Pol polyprotein from type-2 retrotransposable element R2DM [Araneus ventricosus]|uniref:Retrovirus-related Pol polyprotein from type-2 retrotransposable element R2DM n=1 Tax=Araneus ventricosus TaxID=182803 RepID=A0A4Y2F9D0_ARAVE|nr:Retrovirus-related Pol polyprotein from type-2 retrotransposable element R2DM [Araneus ventricosus]
MPTSSDSSNPNDSEFVLSFREDPIPDDLPPEDSGPIFDSSAMLQTVQELRNDLDVTNTSLLELFTSYSSSSVLSAELKEAWEGFKKRPCREMLFIRICLIFDVLLPDKSRSSIRTRRNRDDPHRGALSRKKLRGIEYAKAQRSFSRNATRFSDSLFNPTGTSKELDSFGDDFRSFWETVMSLRSNSGPAPVFSLEPTQQDDGFAKNLLCPISLEEINRCFPRNNSAPGPDNNSTVGDLESISRFELLKIFNVFLFCRKVPERFCKAKTIFIPKKSDVINPGDFRPISLTPIPARLFSKILAKRLSPATKIDPEQRGFIETDGISQNIFMLDFILTHVREKVKRTCIASLDIKRAFDSVSQQAVFAALEAQSVDPEFIKIIKFIYQNSTTSFAPFPCHFFKPTCGVKQGDPLSSLLFNLVIDQLMKKLKDKIGLNIDGFSMPISAYADDLLLFASSPAAQNPFLFQSQQMPKIRKPKSTALSHSV